MTNHPETNSLISAIKRHVTEDQSLDTSIPALQLSWYTAATQLTAIVYEPCLCIVAQGAKEVVLAGETYPMAVATSLLVSVDLPVDARVVEATNDKPYLGLRISLDPKMIGEMLAKGTRLPPGASSERGLTVTSVDRELLDAVTRLVTLLDKPNDVGPLAPLVLQEITHRVLSGPQGFRLRQMALAGTPTNLIAKAIRWLKEHFSDRMNVEELADQVGMSSSSFHQHFKNVTAMTPLQYQKRMRLQEARNLMVGERLDAAEAGFRVGYESPSQFSREYRRMFGVPPRQDVAALLQEFN